MTTFTTATYQNEYLPAGATIVDAIVTVMAEGGGAAPVVTGVSPGAVPSGSASEIIICDTSGSMETPAAKIRAAREATAAAISLLPDGTWFGVISGDTQADLIYPPSTHGQAVLVQANKHTRQEAMAIARRMQPGGGTAIGMWLALANDLFRTVPAERKHAILLTDGKNESETADHLRAVLDHCVGNFQCDCRGIGTDWAVSELRLIANALLGTVDIIADPADLVADFQHMMTQATAKQIASARLRLWIPQGAKLRFVKQVSPNIDDISGKGASVNPLTTEFPLGSWGNESRDYHVQIEVAARGVGDEMLAARTSVVVGDDVVGQALVKAMWTDDEHLSTRINREVAHYTGQAELAEVIQEGLAAQRAGDDRTATVKLGRAVQLAEQTGNDGTKRLLANVVDVEDADTGTVRLKRKVDAADEMALDTRSTRTTRVAPPPSAP
jgi:von Willebrand factor type A C-terminal domain/von Willebrand factor type A domain